MQEPGANEELFSLIVDSLVDWDANMQIECASSFIKPLELGLVSELNKEKAVRVSVQISTDEDWAENNELISSWIKVLEAVVGKVKPSFVSENVIEPLKNLMAHKNAFERRKLGNRILFSVAKHTGEGYFDYDPNMIKLML